MLLKIIKTSVLVVVTASTLSAAAFNAQAEGDRIALKNYFTAKFKSPATDNGKFFPYSTKEELKKMRQNVPASDFKDGTYAFDLIGKVSRDDQMEMPPFEDNIEAGEALFNKHFKNCLTAPVNTYPIFDEDKNKVVTLSGALMSCVKKAGLKTGKKDWNMKGGKMADVQAYLVNQASEDGKKVDVKIQSAAAAAAYENGKQEYYSQRGYLKLSCATCHVQGAGQRVRLQYLSQLTGQVTHFPVYRVGKGKLFTLEGRLGGCNRDEGENYKLHKPGSTWSNNVLYFMSYMSNGMDIALDVRR